MVVFITQRLQPRDQQKAIEHSVITGPIITTLTLLDCLQMYVLAPQWVTKQRAESINRPRSLPWMNTNSRLLENLARIQTLEACCPLISCRVRDSFPRKF